MGLGCRPKNLPGLAGADHLVGINVPFPHPHAGRAQRQFQAAFALAEVPVLAFDLGQHLIEGRHQIADFVRRFVVHAHAVILVPGDLLGDGGEFGDRVGHHALQPGGQQHRHADQPDQEQHHDQEEGFGAGILLLEIGADDDDAPDFAIQLDLASEHQAFGFKRMLFRQRERRRGISFRPRTTERTQQLAVAEKNMRAINLIAGFERIERVLNFAQILERDRHGTVGGGDFGNGGNLRHEILFRVESVVNPDGRRRPASTRQSWCPE